MGTGGAGLGDGGGGGAPGSSGGSTGSGGAAPTTGCGTDGTFACMAPPMLAPLTRTTAGQWTYQEIDGAMCRDGSPAGFYTRFSDTSKKLVIYLEQGGACMNTAVCTFNPKNVNESIAGRTFAEVTNPGVTQTKQAPQTTGIFDYTNPENPYTDWNAIWIPYCTGDAFGGSNPNGSIPGVDATKFVGYMNMQKFVGHIVPTFSDAERVVLTGTSAGSFGAGLNFNQVQDAFGKVPVTLIMDSGIPFSDGFMAPALQQQWRDLWNFAPMIPPDCTDCTQPDGGGLLNLVFYSAKKYKTVKAAIISAEEDDIMKFFFGFGETSGSYPTGKYPQGLEDLRTRSQPYASQFASYFIAGKNHMYEQFPDFYQPLSGGVTLASWTKDVLAGTMNNVGP
ncbi:MAG TPA: pectin acetylesterase-family hydrolase [Polyangiaceae bacterium]|nr:pectin acetylesterase-family hydrolase [Polyangiaceae bacterium]